MNEKMTNESYESGEIESRSLDLLHEGQEAASSGDMETARDKVEQSLVIAKNEDNLEWIAYLEGTIAYINGDLTELRYHINNAGDNGQVLSHLAHGLENRGTPNYKEDCSN